MLFIINIPVLGEYVIADLDSKSNLDVYWIVL